MNTNKDEVLDDNTHENSEKKNDSTEKSTENTSETGNNGGNTGVEVVNEERLYELETKVAEANDKYMRLYSEFDNFRKRTTKERADLIKSAGEDVFKLVLPILDDFERAIKANENADDIKAMAEGFQLIYNKLQNTLKQKGLEEFEAKGKTFDADVMEAITSFPAPSEDLKGKVMDEVEKGYTLNGKVIRFAKVIIGS